MDPSPYRPPTLVDEPEAEPLDESGQPVAQRLPLPLPLWVSAVFTAAAIAVHFGMMFSRLGANASTAFATQLYLPAALLTLFMLFCLGWYGSQPRLGSRSLRGKLLIALLVPPVSLLIFVPAFLAITVAVFAVGYWPLLMVIPLASAYSLTAIGISRWLWWWFACRR